MQKQTKSVRGGRVQFLSLPAGEIQVSVLGAHGREMKPIPNTSVTLLTQTDGKLTKYDRVFLIGVTGKDGILRTTFDAQPDTTKALLRIRNEDIQSIDVEVEINESEGYHFVVISNTIYKFTAFRLKRHGLKPGLMDPIQYIKDYGVAGEKPKSKRKNRPGAGRPPKMS